MASCYLIWYKNGITKQYEVFCTIVIFISQLALKHGSGDYSSVTEILQTQISSFPYRDKLKTMQERVSKPHLHLQIKVKT